MSVADPHKVYLWCLGSGHDSQSCNECAMMQPKVSWDHEAKMYVTEHQRKQYKGCCCSKSGHRPVPTPCAGPMTSCHCDSSLRVSLNPKRKTRSPSRPHSSLTTFHLKSHKNAKALCGLALGPLLRSRV